MAELKPDKLPEGNSHKIKEKKRDDGFVAKADNFITPIIDDVIIPGAQDMLCDIVDGVFSSIRNGIVSAITGEEVNERISITQHRRRNGKRVNYSRKLGDSRPSSNVRDERGKVKESSRISDLTVYSRDDAISVVEQLIQICNDYGRVTCNELYSLDEIHTSCPFTYADFGWKDLSEDNCSIIKNGDGTYGFDLPKPRHL